MRKLTEGSEGFLSHGMKLAERQAELDFWI